ncbi:MAG: Rrf2 family transcriptional regulator [Clostridiales bacterium]|nr:Rrf2 family transcriptional regulator [Clostridiales bacterium]
MKFSKKSRYGLTALIDLSVYSKSGHVALSSIAQRNGISVQYLEQVFGALRRAGIIKSVKGPQGGYLLGRSSRCITVAEVIEALEGSYHLADEIAYEKGGNAAAASVIQHQVVETVNAQMDRLLQGITLDDLEREYTNYQSNNETMYYI